MRKRVLGLSLCCATLFGLCSPTDAQQKGKIPRIGLLDRGTAASAVHLDAFRHELSKLGWIERKSVTIEYRFAEGKTERLPEHAAELVRLKVDLIVVTGSEPTFAAKGATTSIPIVMTSFPDPVGEGLVASLARPGGNVTGLSSLTSELNSKRVDTHGRGSSATRLQYFARLSLTQVLSYPAAWPSVLTIRSDTVLRGLCLLSYQRAVPEVKRNIQLCLAKLSFTAASATLSKRNSQEDW